MNKIKQQLLYPFPKVSYKKLLLFFKKHEGFHCLVHATFCQVMAVLRHGHHIRRSYLQLKCENEGMSLEKQVKFLYANIYPMNYETTQNIFDSYNQMLKNRQIRKIVNNFTEEENFIVDDNGVIYYK